MIIYLYSTFGPSDDQGRDTLLSRNILMHSWVEPRHFNLPEFNFSIFESAGNGINIYLIYIINSLINYTNLLIL